jgi:hypothetical protein
MHCTASPLLGLGIGIASRTRVTLFVCAASNQMPMPIRAIDSSRTGLYSVHGKWEKISIENYISFVCNTSNFYLDKVQLLF